MLLRMITVSRKQVNDADNELDQVYKKLVEYSNLVNKFNNKLPQLRERRINLQKMVTTLETQVGPYITATPPLKRSRGIVCITVVKDISSLKRPIIELAHLNSLSDKPIRDWELDATGKRLLNEYNAAQFALKATDNEIRHLYLDLNKAEENVRIQKLKYERLLQIKRTPHSRQSKRKPKTHYHVMSPPRRDPVIEARGPVLIAKNPPLLEKTIIDSDVDPNRKPRTRKKYTHIQKEFIIIQHEYPLKCPICEDGFENWGDLLRHQYGLGHFVSNESQNSDSKA